MLDEASVSRTSLLLGCQILVKPVDKQLSFEGWISRRVTASSFEFLADGYGFHSSEMSSYSLRGGASNVSCKGVVVQPYPQIRSRGGETETPERSGLLRRAGQCPGEDSLLRPRLRLDEMPAVRIAYIIRTLTTLYDVRKSIDNERFANLYPGSLSPDGEKLVFRRCQHCLVRVARMVKQDRVAVDYIPARLRKRWNTSG